MGLVLCSPCAEGSEIRGYIMTLQGAPAQEAHRRVIRRAERAAMGRGVCAKCRGGPSVHLVPVAVDGEPVAQVPHFLARNEPQELGSNLEETQVAYLKRPQKDQTNITQRPIKKRRHGEKPAQENVSATPKHGQAKKWGQEEQQRASKGDSELLGLPILSLRRPALGAPAVREPGA